MKIEFSLIFPRSEAIVDVKLTGEIPNKITLNNNNIVKTDETLLETKTVESLDLQINNDNRS